MPYGNTVEMPSQEFLCERFEYNPETGIVIWKNRPRHHFNGRGYEIFKSKCVGKPVGSYKNGYFIIGITDEKGRRSTYMLHRIIYKMMTGKHPEFIDHINGIRDDNRWENLRDVSVMENNMNLRIKCNNTTGHTGVYYLKDKNYYHSAINFNGQKIHLGTYDDIATAGAAYRGAAAAITAITGYAFLTDRCRRLTEPLAVEESDTDPDGCKD